jgi:hypothetical protein
VVALIDSPFWRLRIALVGCGVGVVGLVLVRFGVDGIGWVVATAGIVVAL